MAGRFKGHIDGCFVSGPVAMDYPALWENKALGASSWKDVVKRGTAARAGQILARADLAGKTGTTNDSHDAWFAGYQYKVAGVAWMGYDQPRNLGARETGGGLALPIWIGYMQKVLKDIPIETRSVPKGVSYSDGDYHYVETPPGTGVQFIAGDERMLPAGESGPNPAPWGADTPSRKAPNGNPLPEERKAPGIAPWRSPAAPAPAPGATS